MRPTSIVVAGAGSSASIRADGGVDFATATSLSLNGVFTAAYDNYMIVVRGNASTASAFSYRLRASGTDATGSNYVRQYIYANNTSVVGSRDTLTAFAAVVGDSSTPTCETQYLYGPALAQPTALRQVTVDPRSSASIVDAANTHSLSTSYDGWTFFLTSGNATGTITVYGMAQ